MIVKLANIKTAGSLSTFERIGNGIKNHLGSFAKEIPAGVALTGGIALADAGTEGLFAKPGEHTKAALTGLGKGAIYGAILSGSEPFMNHGLGKLMKIKTI